MVHIILMRGLAREAAHWLEFPERLRSALGENCKLHLVDFPGCGIHYRQPALRSIGAMTDHLRALPEVAAVIAAGAPLYLLGISMGGMVALDWAQRFPAEVRGVILINSSSGDQPVWWRLRPGAWTTMLLALALPCKGREEKVLQIVSNRRECYAQFLQQWLAIQQQHPISRSTIFRMLLAAKKFRPQSECVVSGLVLTSDRDRMVSPRASEALAERFDWPLVRHGGCGHDLPMDDPQWVVNETVQWLRNNQ